MKKTYSYPGWSKRVAVSAAALCVAATAAHAQTITAYATGFDGTDITNGTAAAAPYLSPATPTDPLDGQNGWGTNDGTQTAGGTNQLIGRSDFVGPLGTIGTGQQGAIGGIYRTTAPTAGAPDVVPSASTGGIVSLFHPVTVPVTSTFLALDVDFTVTTPAAFAARDTFSLALRNTAGTPLISFNFSPSVNNPNTQDAISITIGGVTTTPGNVITLNAGVHLTLTVDTRAKTYTATITGSSYSGSLAGSAINPTDVTQFATVWNLQNKTATGNALNGAGDEYLIFDNLAVTVPEPSTYAMMALGLVGLVSVLRLRRQQA